VRVATFVTGRRPQPSTRAFIPGVGSWSPDRPSAERTASIATKVDGSSYGSRRLDRAFLNHLRNISSVSIISVKPALLIFTVETIEGGPGSA
jgi:hypothetical protein